MMFTDHNVAEAYHTGGSSTRNAAFRYMLRNFASVSDVCGFQRYVDVETLCRLLASVAVQATPDERLEAVLQWTRYDVHLRHGHLPRLLAHLPGGLIDEDTIKSLRYDALFTSCRRACRALNDLASNGELPYYDADTTHALGITSISEDGGEKLFRFTTADGMAEFEVNVIASEYLRHLKFELRCNRVSVHETCRLPENVSAHLRVRVCRQEGRHGDMVHVEGACMDEDDITLVCDGSKKMYKRSIHYDTCEMRRIVKCGRKIALFISVKEFCVNGRNFVFDHGECKHHHVHKHGEHWHSHHHGHACRHEDEHISWHHHKVCEHEDDDDDDDNEKHHCHCHNHGHHHHNHHHHHHHRHRCHRHRHHKHC